MKEKHNGMFAKHFVKDPEMRRVLNNTLKLSNDAYANFANDINGHDLLIIDDTISQGASIRETINIINETYSPNSVTILTMFSKLYDE
jgi:hypoxanthine-guanine phosphoribosyltransferase